MRTSSQAPDAGPLLPVSDRHVKHWLTTEARALGFADCRIAPADIAFHQRLEGWLAAGHHAGMHWMADRQRERGSPVALWPEAKSVVMLSMNYGPDSDPLATLARPDVGTISVYARHRDYHDVIKGKLKELAQKLAARTGVGVKVFVDTAPLMEKPLAQAAGLGWQGKHTVLLSRQHGNWLFLGAILTTLALEPDEPESEHCGSCRRCLDICPTQAFPAPHVLDSRRCISYLTIEHKGPIDRDLRPLMGNRVYGCDDCLAVCPWNKFAQVAREAKLRAREDLAAPALVDLLALDDPRFRARFSGSPIKRTGRNRFMRNVLIAAGNAIGSKGAGRAVLLDAVRPHLDDPDPVVRGAAVWALRRLDPAGAMPMKDVYLPQETVSDVRAEWEASA